MAGNDGRRPFYERKTGELSIHLDIFDAKAVNPEQFGSRQYFLVNLSDRFAAMLEKTELHKLKGFFDKRNTLKDTTIEYFTDKCLCIVCPSSLSALQRLQKDYESGRLERFFVECFVTPVAMKKLEVTSMKLKIHLSPPELKKVEAEWLEGAMPQTYDMDKNEKSYRMLRLVKQFQLNYMQNSETGCCTKLREAEAKYEASLTSLINFLKMLRSNSMVPIKCAKEVIDLYEKEKTNSPDGKLVEQYFDTLRGIGKSVRVIETSISFPLAQIRVGGENEEQLKRKKEMFQIIQNIKEALREDQPFHLKHETYVAKVSGSERLVLSGFICLLPSVIRMMLDLDETIDEYFNSGSVVFKPSELSAN
ncbi:hypothetical protein BOX15_Mlig017406g1 [Macrostomum lignano]|nr:hypothetical protein BOX15_Mlig011699g1 [Macrostomum lignano]PAA80155.1 hypothetical protein BOX15_Mlig024500g1 [Macrostomum lignano]PAA88304.1 hypothetical protein BOX15_Mlig017406g1 [Macrostomum lignano]